MRRGEEGRGDEEGVRGGGGVRERCGGGHRGWRGGGCREVEPLCVREDGFRRKNKRIKRRRRTIRRRQREGKERNSGK